MKKAPLMGCLFHAKNAVWPWTCAPGPHNPQPTRQPTRQAQTRREATMRNKLRPNGPRGYAMLSLSLVALFRAFDYLKPAQPGYTPSALRELAAIIPTWVWGILWGVTGVWVLYSAFRERQALALAMLAGMSFLWATIYVLTAAFRGASVEAPAAWLSALGFVAFAVIVVALAKMINPAPSQEVEDA